MWISFEELFSAHHNILGTVLEGLELLAGMTLRLNLVPGLLSSQEVERKMGASSRGRQAHYPPPPGIT